MTCGRPHNTSTMDPYSSTDNTLRCTCTPCHPLFFLPLLYFVFTSYDFFWRFFFSYFYVQVSWWGVFFFLGRIGEQRGVYILVKGSRQSPNGSFSRLNGSSVNAQWVEDSEIRKITWVFLNYRTPYTPNTKFSFEGIQQVPNSSQLCFSYHMP